MPSILAKDKRTAALAALKQAEAFIQGARETVDGDAKKLVDTLMEEGQRVKQAGMALVLALISDEYTPAELFKPWASVRRIRDWRDDPDVKLDVIIRHGRVCVKPSDFFKHWKTLKE